MVRVGGRGSDKVESTSHDRGEPREPRERMGGGGEGQGKRGGEGGEDGEIAKGLRLGGRLGGAKQNGGLAGPRNTPVGDLPGGKRLTGAVLDFLENTRGEGRRPSRPPARNGLRARVGRVAESTSVISFFSSVFLSLSSPLPRTLWV